MKHLTTAMHQEAQAKVPLPQILAESHGMDVTQWPLGRLEKLPKWLICIPLGLQWAGLGLRYQSFMCGSAANPLVTTGGLVGERKEEYWKHAGAVARSFLLTSLTVAQDISPTQLSPQLQAAGLDFPLIVKPSLGLSGYGVQKFNDLSALQHYLQIFPVGQTVVLQPFLNWPGEAGLFYWRRTRSEKRHSGRAGPAGLSAGGWRWDAIGGRPDVSKSQTAAPSGSGTSERH